MLRRILIAALLAAILTPASAVAHEQPHPLVIGHRGTAGYLPDHTLPGYALAIKLGADYIEPDLVVDQGRAPGRPPRAQHHRHDRRRRAPRVRRPQAHGGRSTARTEEGWFVSDFTLAELRTLRAVQPLAGAPAAVQRASFRIPTLEQVIALAKRYSKRYHRTIGIYPETKHPTYHKSIGLPLERKLVKALDKAGLNHRRVARVHPELRDRRTSSGSTRSRPCGWCS